MFKKLINSAAVFAMIVAVIAPAMASAGSVSVASEVANISGDKQWTTQATAKAGDTLYYSVKVNNNTSAVLTGVATFTDIPAGLSYVAGSGKVVYREAGVDKTASLSDGFALGNGVSLADIPAMTYIYIAFKAKVAESATAGVYAPTTKVIATANGSAVNLADNRAKTTVAVSGTPSTETPATTTPVVTTPVVTTPAVTGTPTVVTAPSARIISNVLNATRNGQNFVSITTANPGEELFYRVTVTNTGNTPLTGSSFKVDMPAGLNLVTGGIVKMYYSENGADKYITLSDGIISNGVSLPDVPVNHFIYVTYKVKVAANANAGTFATGNKFYSNGGAVAISDNGGRINVEVAGQVAAPAPSARIISNVVNATREGKNFVSVTTATPGEELFYRVTVTNTGNTPLTGAAFKVDMPAGLNLVTGGIAKMYYSENGVDKYITLSDGLVSNGVSLPDVPVNHFIYVTYKVKVADNVNNGTFATGNKFYSNNGAVAISDNGGRINVEGGNTPSVAAKSLSIDTTVYDSASKNYVHSLNIKRGDSTKVRVAFSNNGQSDLSNVRITNSISANLEYVAGSMKVVVNGATISTSDSVMTSGVAISNLATGANGYMEFTVKVKSDTPSNISQLGITSTGNADGIAQISSLATLNLLGNGTVLPSTGASTSVVALILLALFAAISGYVYLKESNALSKAASLIKG